MQLFHFSWQLAQRYRQCMHKKLAPQPLLARLAGFTLIELSIVLVVIGLIVGGVLVGQDLILAAKMRSQASYTEKLNLAILAFRVKYDCLPGDCPDAELYGLGPDGNGDRLYFANRSGGGVTLCESQGTVIHLGNAGLMPWDTASMDCNTPDNDVDDATGNPPFLEYHRFGAPHELLGDGSSSYKLYWMISGSSGDAAIIAQYDRKFDDSNGFTGKILIDHEELTLTDPNACIDSTGAYRQEGASVLSCFVYQGLNY